MEDNIQTLLRQAHAASPECCPLDDDAVMYRIEKAVEHVRVRRWGWLPYSVAAVVVLATVAMQQPLAAQQRVAYTHGISLDTVERLNYEILEAL